MTSETDGQQITVADLLKRMGEGDSTPTSRRHRREGAGGVSVAELTGEIPVIRADTERPSDSSATAGQSGRRRRRYADADDGAGAGAGNVGDGYGNPSATSTTSAATQSSEASGTPAPTPREPEPSRVPFPSHEPNTTAAKGIRGRVSSAEPRGSGTASARAAQVPVEPETTDSALPIGSDHTQSLTATDSHTSRGRVSRQLRGSERRNKAGAPTPERSANESGELGARSRSDQSSRSFTNNKVPAASAPVSSSYAGSSNAGSAANKAPAVDDQSTVPAPARDTEAFRARSQVHGSTAFETKGTARAQPANGEPSSGAESRPVMSPPNSSIAGAMGAAGVAGAAALATSGLGDNASSKAERDYSRSTSKAGPGSENSSVDPEEHSAEADVVSGDQERGSVAQWAILVAQVLASAVAGAALFIGFQLLWQDLPWVAVALSVVVVLGLVAVVRVLRRSNDWLSITLAVVVGLAVTCGPLVLMMILR